MLAMVAVRLHDATIRACERAGFSPRFAHDCDDTVIVQSLVGAGMGVAIINWACSVR